MSYKSARLNLRYEEKVDPNEFLLCYRIPRNLSADEVATAMLPASKYAQMVNGRILGRNRGEYHELLLSFLKQEEADLVRLQLETRLPSHLEPVPEPDRKGWTALGHVPGLKEAGLIVADRVSADPEFVESMIQGMADVMDEVPADQRDDLLFKLPDDVYRAAKARRQKPQ